MMKYVPYFFAVTLLCATFIKPMIKPMIDEKNISQEEVQSYVTKILDDKTSKKIWLRLCEVAIPEILKTEAVSAKRINDVVSLMKRISIDNKDTKKSRL